MASSLSFVSGTTRIDLNDRVGFFMERGFVPSVDVTQDNTVVETVQVQFRGAVSANLNRLNRLFEIARRMNPAEDTVFVEYKVAEGEDAWRSKIRDGKVEAGPKLANEYKKGRVNLEITFERDPFWEGPEMPLPIGNANGGKVYNCNDGVGSVPNKRINSAYITTNMIEGDLPAPAKIEIKNLYDVNLGWVWIGMNKTRPNWLSGWSLEAESAIGITPVTMAGASGGAIAKGQLAFGYSEAILKWAIPESLVSMIRGQNLRLLLRPHFTGAYQNFKYRLRILRYTTVVYETDWIRESEKYARHWLDLFDIRMPPWLEGETGLDGLTLEIWATPNRDGTWTWAFDDLMMFADDSFVEAFTDVPENGKLVIDGETGWAETADGKKFGLRKMVGSIMLEPRAFHLLYFALHTTYLNDAPIDMVVEVSGSYRPRRWLI